MNFVISLKQTKTKTAKQERSTDVHTLSNSLNETTKVVMLPAFHTKLMQLPTDHKRPYLELLFFIVENGNILNKYHKLNDWLDLVSSTVQVKMSQCTSTFLRDVVFYPVEFDLQRICYGRG